MLVARAFQEHGSRLKHLTLPPGDPENLEQLVRGTAPRAVLDSALFHLTRHLAKATGENVIVLVDEYDTLIHASFVNPC